MSQDLSPPRAVCELEGAGPVREPAVEQDGRRLPSSSAAHGNCPADLLLSHLQQELKSKSEIGGVGCLV